MAISSDCPDSTVRVDRRWSLEQWLHWQETLHPSTIELGLGRVAQVAGRLGLIGDLANDQTGDQTSDQPSDQPSSAGKLPFAVIAVAGTNGKGSSIAMLEAIYRAAGYTTAAYTSPHLLRYNERVRLDGVEVSDEALCDAFERVDAARGKVSLTYFEFGTLAALWLIKQQMPDIALLEIGLGGRLDAVNIVDADVALITNIALDHQQWLGDDRDSIAAEKAGILRAGVPVVFGEHDLPTAIADRATQLGAALSWPAHGFDYRALPTEQGGWRWSEADGEALTLPLPALPGNQQIANAAAVVAVVRRLQPRLPVTGDALRDGLLRVRLAGRMQSVAAGSADEVPLILDVAHNPHAAEALAAHLTATPVSGQTRAVLAVLDDKDLPGMLAALLPLIDGWYCAGLPDSPRALPLEALAGTLETLSGNVPVHRSASPQQALQAAQAASSAGDRIVAFGSFFTVAALAHG